MGAAQAYPLGRPAIEATEIAPVGDRDAEITYGALKGIEKGHKPSVRCYAIEKFGNNTPFW